MNDPGRWLRHSLAAVLVLLPLHVSAEKESGPAASPPSPLLVLTPAEEDAYESRKAFFRKLPGSYRPDLDWRTSLSPSLADAEPEWSQGYEELIIRDFFGDREAGFFVDVGCYRPKVHSTTFYLEDRQKWRGIAIDAVERYRKGWKKVRPDATFVHAAISDTDGEIVELHVAGMMASLDGKVIDGFGLSEIAETIEVETATLNTILDQHQVEKIDFLSIDIEGAEVGALRGLDIKRFRPELVGIETNRHETVVRYFESNGYELIEKYRKVDKINMYFRPGSTE